MVCCIISLQSKDGTDLVKLLLEVSIMIYACMETSFLKIVLYIDKSFKAQKAHLLQCVASFRIRDYTCMQTPSKVMSLLRRRMVYSIKSLQSKCGTDLLELL